MVVPSVAGITFVVLSEAKDLTPVPQNAIGAGARSFATLRMTGKASFYLAEIGGLQLDRSAVRRAMRRAAPGIAIARQRLGAGDAFRRNERLERVQPVSIVGLAGVGIAGRLRPLDLGAECCRPFRPGEQAALVQGEGHGERLRLPRFAED